MLTPHFLEHKEVPAGLQGIDGFKQFFSMPLGAFPDFRMDVQDMIAEGDKVAARISVHGTHQGEYMGMSPTRNRIEVTAIDIFRIEGSKITGHWSSFENLGMMQQLGAVPSLG